jgi:hypothetical protein
MGKKGKMGEAKNIGRGMKREGKINHRFRRNFAVEKGRGWGRIGRRLKSKK